MMETRQTHHEYTTFTQMMMMMMTTKIKSSLPIYKEDYLTCFYNASRLLCAYIGIKYDEGIGIGISKTDRLILSCCVNQKYLY